MDDLELDRALDAALSVEPSPEFVARVRTALAETPRPLVAGGWVKPAAAIAGTAVVLIAVWLPRENVPPQAGLSAVARQLPASFGETRRSLGEGGKPSTTYVPSSPSVVVPTFRSAKAAEPEEPPLPEVIVAAEDVEALRQLLVSLNEHKFVASFEETPVSTPWVMTSLSVAPIGGDALDSPPAHNN